MSMTTSRSPRQTSLLMTPVGLLEVGADRLRSRLHEPGAGGHAGVQGRHLEPGAGAAGEGAAALALATQPQVGLLHLERDILRETLAAKLETMKGIQPGRYARLSSIDDVISVLEEDPLLSANEWARLVYLKSKRDRFNPALLKKAVQTLLVPLLR
jgi:hypothetical protein